MAASLSPVLTGTRPISTKRYALPPPIVKPFETFQLSVFCVENQLAIFSPHWHKQKWHEYI